MALIFCDSFDHYVDAQINLKWASNLAWTISAGNGRNGTASGRSTRTDRYVRKTFGTNYATLIVGFALTQSGFATNTPLITFQDATTNQVYLCTDASGHLQVKRGNVNAPTLLATGTVVLSSGVNYYIEIKVTIHPSAGVAVVKVNGVTDINLSGANTRNTANSTTDGFELSNDQGNTGIGYVRDYDDLYVCDTSGGAPNNDFLGDVRVQALMPNGAGASSAWTPNSAVANYTTVDEASPNDDTDYNSDAVAGDRDTYAFGNLTPTTGTVYGAQVLMYARKDDAGVRTIASVVRHSGVNYDGTGQNIGTTYTYYAQVYETNPGTAAAWTVTDVNAAEFGIKLVA